MSALQGLVDEVRGDVGDECPRPVVVGALLKAARSLFDVTGVWRQVVSFSIAAGALDRDVSGLLSGDLAYVVASESEPGGLAYEIDGGVFRLQGALPCDVWVTLTLAIMPKSVAADIPDDVLRVAKDAIVSGALSDLYGKPRKAWSDKILARDHAEDFRKGVGRVRCKVSAGVMQEGCVGGLG